MTTAGARATGPAIAALFAITGAGAVLLVAEAPDKITPGGHLRPRHGRPAWRGPGPGGR